MKYKNILLHTLTLRIVKQIVYSFVKRALPNKYQYQKQLTRNQLEINRWLTICFCYVRSVTLHCNSYSLNWCWFIMVLVIVIERKYFRFLLLMSFPDRQTYTWCLAHTKNVSNRRWDERSCVIIAPIEDSKKNSLYSWFLFFRSCLSLIFFFVFARFCCVHISYFVISLSITILFFRHIS